MAIVKKLAGRIIILSCVALFCLVLPGCPDSPDIPVPAVNIHGADIVNRGGIQEFTYKTLNLDHIGDHSVIWSVLSTEQALEGLGDEDTFINSQGVLYVSRYDLRPSVIVRASMMHGPRISGQTEVTLRDPETAVAGITVALSHPAVHRGEFIEAAAAVHWEDGLPPLSGPRGVVFSLINSEDGGDITPIGEIGPHNTEIRLTVSEDQMPGVGEGGLVVRATARYDSEFSVDIPIHVLQPTVDRVEITQPDTRGEGGVHRGEPNTFTATVIGRGNPFQDIAWSIVPEAGQDFLSSTVVEGGTLVVNEHCLHSQNVTVRASSTSIHNQGAASADSTVFILTPVITRIAVDGPAFMDRDTTRRFSAKIESRGNPYDAVIEWSVEGNSSDQTVPTPMGWGHFGDVFLPPNERSDHFYVRAALADDPLIFGKSGRVSVAPGGYVPGDWRLVALGSDHSLALRWDNTLYSWGRDMFGRLGNGNVVAQNAPIATVTRPEGITEHNNLWRDLSAGLRHSVGIRGDGTLWVWGNNQFGQLGVHPATPLDGGQLPSNSGVGAGSQVQATPMFIRAARAFTWSSVSAGRHHVAGIKVDGTLYTFGAAGNVAHGNNPSGEHNGQLGRALAPANSGVTGAPGEIRPHWAPGRVTIPGLPDDGWAMVAAGTWHTAALRHDGSLWTWGRNNYGQLGIGSVTGNQHLPQEVAHPGGLRWEFVGAGEGMSLAIDSDGVLWTWGNNAAGALGRLPTNPQTPPGAAGIPVPVPGPLPHPVAGRRWASVAVGEGSQHVAAIDDKNHLWTWGRNQQGQLGWGAAYHVFDAFDAAVYGNMTPDQREMLSIPRQPMPGTEFKVALAGRWFTMAITTDGRLYGWGDNRFGQVGDGTSYTGGGNPDQSHLEHIHNRVFVPTEIRR
ncbi:MAG: hypothetical protein FWC64_07475 [Treponema sp.]|nr:hypothetical protein [Treponema sp.]